MKSQRSVITVPESADAAGGASDLLHVGDVVDGKFEVRARLGSGGMGQVWQAYDRSLGRHVAIKLAWEPVPGMLRKEAQALAALKHPGVIAVHAFGWHDGREYMVMELIRGKTLEQHIERRVGARSRFAISEATETLTGIASALAAVHRAGLAHRDVKPANVMLAPGDRVVLTDFGIFLPEQMRQRHSIVGSPLYMAPETIRGRIAPGELFLVDAYALGVVAFEILTGRGPFEDHRADVVMAMHLESLPPELASLRSDVPPRLARLVHQLLEKEPKSRPQSMEEVLWQLRPRAREWAA